MNDYEKPESMKDLGDDLCDYCPLDDEAKYHGPWGIVYCRGDHCEEAYANYLEGFEVE